jgi:YcaO-like protein with predicted kinase domain
VSLSSANSSQPLPGWLDGDVSGAGSHDPYSDRVRSPEETIRRLQPFLPAIGITRLAQVTKLDRIGIPVWVAIRPNAATLSVSQGKGITDDAARASALMEATELSVAEAASPAALIASRDAMKRDGRPVIATQRYLRRGAVDYGHEQDIRWLEGFDLIARRMVFVPEEISGFVRPAGVHTSRYRQTSDGLASGNVLIEAVFHGLCERIERDAMALWAFRSDQAVAARRIDPASFGDTLLSELAARVDHAGLLLRLYDVTSDIAVPTFFAVIAPRFAPGDLVHMDVASGSGCHPLSVRAALRAVTEAAQSRLTTISGARDDFASGEYRRRLTGDLSVYLDPATLPSMMPSPGYGGPPDLSRLLTWTVERLEAARIGSAVVIPLGGEDFGVAVAKVIVGDLEDHPDDPDRRPGRRAIRAMMGAR